MNVLFLLSLLTPMQTPVGITRTARVLLDSAQYQLDVNQLGGSEAFENLYGSINLVVMRKPEENNFKAILETIRQLMRNPEHTVGPKMEMVCLGKRCLWVSR
jgi:hypothetical protein